MSEDFAFMAWGSLARIGRYEIVGQLGSGGMGSVYLGRTVGPGGFERLVAVKTIHPHLSSSALLVQMFLDEARLSARIRHPNVVPVFEVGEDAGRYYLVMDYVSGEGLNRVLGRAVRNDHPVPYGLAIHIAFSISEALHAAHELTDSEGKPLGVIHRDVTPKNILIGYDGVVRLCDFGVVKAKNQLSDAGASMRGTVAYMAPEQLDPNAVLDRRVDVFALGVVLWELTVLRRLFRGRTDLETAENVRTTEIPRPSSLTEHYPPELERVILKALERDPERRFATARDMGSALREVLEAHRSHVLHVDVEAFIHELFADRRALRLQLERAAALGTPDLLTLIAGEEESRRSRRPLVAVEPTEPALDVSAEITDEPSGPLITRVIDPLLPTPPVTDTAPLPERTKPARSTWPWVQWALVFMVTLASALLTFAWRSAAPEAPAEREPLPAAIASPADRAPEGEGEGTTSSTQAGSRGASEAAVKPAAELPPQPASKPASNAASNAAPEKRRLPQRRHAAKASHKKHPVLLDGTDL